VEALQEALGGLLRERELLRGSDSKGALESNRKEIVRVQLELCHAFATLYG
jgi:hypothetical protein